MVSILEAIEDEDGEVDRDQITEILDETPGSLDFNPVGIFLSADCFKAIALLYSICSSRAVEGIWVMEGTRLKDGKQGRLAPVQKGGHE